MGKRGCLWSLVLGTRKLGCFVLKGGSWRLCRLLLLDDDIISPFLWMGNIPMGTCVGEVLKICCRPSFLVLVTVREEAIKYNIIELLGRQTLSLD